MKRTRLLQVKISAKLSWSLNNSNVLVGKPFPPAMRAAFSPVRFDRKVNGILNPKSQNPITLHIQYGRHICTAWRKNAAHISAVGKWTI